MSLNDLFMERALLQHQNALNSDTTGMLLESLASGVAQGIQERQAEMKAQRQAKINNKKAIDTFKSLSGGSGGKNGTLIPSLKMKADRTFEVTASSPSPSERKSIYELEIAKQKSDVIDKYINNEISDIDLLNNIGKFGITDSEFEVANQARKKLIELQTKDKVKNDNIVQNQIDIQSSGVPEGYRAVYEKDKFGNMSVKNIEKIPMTEIKAIKEMEDDNILKETKNRMVVKQAEDTIKTISDIKSRSNNFGFLGSVPSLPGTDRYIWQTNVDKLLSRRIIDLMMEMKDASKTGATGFGQLSEKELKVLQDASTALKKGLPEEKALEYLSEMESMAQKVIDGYIPRNKEPLVETYMKKYPERSRDEIIKALRKRGDL